MTWKKTKQKKDCKQIRLNDKINAEKWFMLPKFVGTINYDKKKLYDQTKENS